MNEQDAVDLLTKVALAALRRVAQLKKLSRGKVNDLAQDAVAQWWERNSYLPEKKTDLLKRQMQDIVNELLQGERDWLEQEQGQLEQERVSTGLFTPAPDEEWEAPAMDSFVDTLDRMRKASPADATKVLILELHLGMQVIPGQPKVLRKGVKDREDKLKDHPILPDCATCKSIARYLRVPGLKPHHVTTIVNRFLVELAQIERQRTSGVIPFPK